MKRTEQTITLNLSRAMRAGAAEFNQDSISAEQMLKRSAEIRMHEDEWKQQFPEHHAAWVEACHAGGKLIDPEKFWTENYRER